MILKNYFIVLLFLLLANGCSLVKTSGDINHAPDNDIEQPANNVENKANEFDPVMESTRLLLQSSPARINVQEQLNDYLSSHSNEPEFNSVWLRLTTMFRFSDIDNKRIQAHKKSILKHKKYLEQISQRAAPFLYFITEEVDKRNIPGEIALLPIIESAFKTRAYSRKKAAGLWQFVPATGRHFGLNQSWWYDGRKDVYKSTRAALTYLEQLNKFYKGDWMLALAAYNAGTGNINKAIRKNRRKGKPTDYWSLDLPKETQQYIPKLLAVTQLVQHAGQYNINLYPIENSPQLMMVDSVSQIELAVVAELTGLPVKEIHTYNPAFNQWATAPDGPHYLLLPIDKVEIFKKNLALLDEKDRMQFHRHKILSGENLSVIAQKYKISIKSLKKMNHLTSNRIRAGKYMMIPKKSAPITKKPHNEPAIITAGTNTPASTSSAQLYSVRKGDSLWKISRNFSMSERKLASLNALSAEDTLAIGQVLKISNKDPVTNRKEISYKVRRGDSLYIISKRFNVSVNDLKNWNGLNVKKYLQPGQNLKVYIKTVSQAI